MSEELAESLVSDVVALVKVVQVQPRFAPSAVPMSLDLEVEVAQVAAMMFLDLEVAKMEAHLASPEVSSQIVEAMVTLALLATKDHSTSALPESSEVVQRQWRRARSCTS